MSNEQAWLECVRVQKVLDKARSRFDRARIEVQNAEIARAKALIELARATQEYKGVEK